MNTTNATSTKRTNPNLTGNKSQSKDFNPYNPETLYKDFDFGEAEIDSSDEVINRDNYENPYSHPSSNKYADDYQKQNKFRYESFAERIKKVKVKLSSNFENDISFLKIESKQGFKLKSTDAESNFLTILNREKVLNTSDEFKKLESELSDYTQSYLIYVNNSDKILKIFSEKIKSQVAEQVKNIPFIISLMEILSGLVKDLRDETYDEFLDNIFPNLIKLLSETQNVEAIEKTFGVLVNIFKFLQNAILKPRNFSKFFYIFSELIFNRTKYIRKFACESISYLIKNLDEEKLGDIMLIILNPFVSPEKYFDVASIANQENADKLDNNIINNKNANSFNENYLEKIYQFDNNMDSINNNGSINNNSLVHNNGSYFINFLHEALLNFEFNLHSFFENDTSENQVEKIQSYNQRLKLNVYLVECLSDFIYEILIGVNKDLSIKADLFLEKLKIKIPNEEITEINSEKQIKIKKENLEYLNFIIDISVVTSLVKLFNRLKNDKRSSIVSLLNFYLLKKINKETKFNKLKSEKITNQLGFYQKLNLNNKMDIDEAKSENQLNRKLIKAKFTKANILTLMNFFIFELFNKCNFKFDKEIKRFYFEFLKLSAKKIEQEGQSLNIFYAVECIKPELNYKDYFTKALKIDLLALLLKFYPEEFSEAFKLDFLTLNPYNKIFRSLDFADKENFEILNLLKIFYNPQSELESRENYIDVNSAANLIDENILHLFLEKLKNLQKFKHFKSLSFFENKSISIKTQNAKENQKIKAEAEAEEAEGELETEEIKDTNAKNKIAKKANLQIENIESQNPYLDNDDYNIDYNADLVNKLFSIVFNFYDFGKVESILDIKTTYDLILIKNSNNDESNRNNQFSNFNFIDETNVNFDSADNIANNYSHSNLLLANNNNLQMIVSYLKNFSLEDFKTNNSYNPNGDFVSINQYVKIYSFLIIGDMLIKSLSGLESSRNKSLSVATDKGKGLEYLDILGNKNNIYFEFIKKSIETILMIFENEKGFLANKGENESNVCNKIKSNFASEILKLENQDDIMLFNILFRDFNDIKTFYIDKSTAFINLLNLFTVNYLKILLLNKKESASAANLNSNQFILQNENELFIARILSILFSNSENGSAFKTINMIVQYYFNSDFNSFYVFCLKNETFFLKKNSIVNAVTEIINLNPATSSSSKNKNNLINTSNLFVNSLEEFLLTYSTIFYSSDNKVKGEFLRFAHLWLKAEKLFNIRGLEEILDLISYTLNLEFDTLNDKKYSLNYEILVSKIELISLDSDDTRGLFVFGFVYDFLLGSYWIRLAKTLWPVLTKCIERFYQALEKLMNEKLLGLIFHKTIKLFDFVYSVGTIENLLENIESGKFEKYYFIFSENFDDNVNKETKNSNCYLENIIKSSFYAKRDNIASLALNVSLFYEGFLKSQHNFEIILNASNSILIEKNQSAQSAYYLFNKFYEFFSRIINPKNENWLNELFRTKDSFNSSVKKLYETKNNKNPQAIEPVNKSEGTENFNKFYMNYFNNFITEKESKRYFGNTNKNLQETILTIISKLNFSLIYKIKQNDFNEKKEEIKRLVFDQLIFSRTTAIQKLCVSIYINMEPKLKKFCQLFEKLIENSNLIDRLYNLQDIRTDGNEPIKEDERELLVPILIRLYYSKYFYLSNKTKKVKTRNKINIVSFFIQLSPEEFKEYIKVIFRPLMIFEDFGSNRNNKPSGQLVLNSDNAMEIDSISYLNNKAINDNNDKESLLKTKFEDEILFSENAFAANDFLNRHLNNIESSLGLGATHASSDAIKFLDLRIYRKIIEILSLNFKQINSLFESSIDFLTIFIANILIFIKKANNFYKTFFEYKKHLENKYGNGKHNHEEEEILFDNQAPTASNEMDLETNTEKNYELELDNFLTSFEQELKKDSNISQSKFLSYWEKDKVYQYSNLYFKFVKEIKKRSFDLLKTIFAKFSFKADLIKIVTDRLFAEYQDIYSFLPQTENLKVNSLLQFTFNIAKNPLTHRIFIDNSNVFVSLCSILTNNKIDNKFLNSLLEFLENLIIPYSEYKIELEEQRLKELQRQGENEYDELRKVKRFEKNKNAKELVAAEDDENDQPRRRKLTTDSNLSFLQSEKDKSEDEDFKNNNSLRNRLGEKVELNKINHETFLENESKLIKQNFKLLNDNLIILLTSGRLKLKIKEYTTERTIYLLLELWNIFEVNDEYFQKYALENQAAISKLLRILIDFISKDSKIFKDEYKNYLANILRLCNILISICENKQEYYLDLMHLIYKISDTQSRLILAVILKQISEPIKREFFLELNYQNKNTEAYLNNFYIGFADLYTVIIRLNITRQGKSLEFSDDLDVDLALENLNIISEEFSDKYSILHLEPLVYQLLSLANFSEDFSIQTLAVAKIKVILDRIMHQFAQVLAILESTEHNENLEAFVARIELESFANMLKVFLNLLNLLNYNTHVNKSSKNSFNGENYMSMNKLKQEKIKKNILDLFSFINNSIHNTNSNNSNNSNNNESGKANNYLLSKINAAEETYQNNVDNVKIINTNVYSIATINFKIFDFNSNAFRNHFNSESYLSQYLNNFSLLICRDLFAIKSEKGDYDFFEGILNLKYDVRSSVLNQLKGFLAEKKIRYFSLLNIIIPVIKGFLNFEAKSPSAINAKNQNNKKDNFDVFHKRDDLNSITEAAIDLLEPISKSLEKDDFLAFLMHFYRRISKANNQDSSRNYEENRYAFEKLYEILSRLLECLNLFKFDFITEFDFDTEFNQTMRELIEEYKSKASLDMFLENKDNNSNNKNNQSQNQISSGNKNANKTNNNNNNKVNKSEEESKLGKINDSKVNKFMSNNSYSKDLFKESFNKVAETYEEKLKAQRASLRNIQLPDANETALAINENNKSAAFGKNKFKDFSQNLTTQIFNMLRNMLIDNYRKDKTKKYYIRNFVIKPFLLVLKKMDPRTLKFELLSLVYEIINNLKNKDLDVREKARHAIRILIETLGPFISNVLFEQLKSQLTSGYQRYIMGYTCNFVLALLNKLYLNFKEIEEHGEAIALMKIINENKMNLEIEENLMNEGEDNENKVITLNNKNKNQNDKSNSKEEEKEPENNNYQKIIQELKSDNKTSSDIHAPVATKNLDFIFLNRYKLFNKKDIELIFDFSIGIVVPILLEELFGEVAEEKEIEQLVRKYKEGKEVKAYSSFCLIASRMDFKTGILNLIFPIRNFVLDKETNNSVINKINEVMNFIIKGLKENITMRIEDIILISYSLINIGLEINIKNSKEIKQNKKITIKGEILETRKMRNDYQTQKNELVSLQLGTNSKKRYSIEIARKFILEKNDIIMSNLFTQFGLDVFFLSIKKNVFDYNSLKANMDKIKERERSEKEREKEKQNSFKLRANENLDGEEAEAESVSSEDSDEYQKDLFKEFNFENSDTNNINNKLAHHHKHRSYYDKHRLNYTETEFKNIINQMEVLLYSVICCLKITSNNILSKSLKILTKLFDSRLFVIKKNLKKIGSNLFKNLGIINLSDSDKTIAQTILSCISEILKKFTFFEVSESQMKILINFLKIYINNLEIKSYIFSCLFAIIKRKFLHPCIYDMIDYIQETYLISFDEAMKSLCESILIEFLNNYPLEEPRKQKHVNFFIVNLESKTRNCVLNSLRMLRKLVDFANKDSVSISIDTANRKDKNLNLSQSITNNETSQVSNVIKDFIDFVLLKLLLLIANSNDAEIKNLSSGIIQEIFAHMITKDKYDLYIGKIMEWIKIEEKIRNKIKKLKSSQASEDDESEEGSEIKEEDYNINLDEKEKTYVKLGLNFLSILSNCENENLAAKANLIFDILIKNIKHEYNKFEKELDKQIENRNYSRLSEDTYKNKKDFDKIFESNLNKDEDEDEENHNKNGNLELKEEELTILSIQLDNWDIYYLHLVTLEKFITLFPKIFSKNLIQDRQFSQVIFRSIKHPHVFVKTVVLRLITKLFSEESNILDMNDFNCVNSFIDNLVTDKGSNYIDNQNVHSNTIQVVLDNLKFVILNKDINLKEDLVNSSIEISSFLVFLLLKLYLKNSELNNSEFEDYSYYAYEFICKLYGQSKKFMAKKDYTNKVIRRILNIFENLVTYSSLKFDMFEASALYENNKNKKNNEKKIKEEIEDSKGRLVEILLEPVLSLLFRLTTNNLIDEEMKVYSENVLNSFKEIVEEEVFSKRYKEISKRISLLRRKRKIEQKQNYLKK